MSTDSATPTADPPPTPSESMPARPARPGVPGLIRLELSRFSSRRAIVWILVCGALLVLLAAFKLAWDTRGLSPDERASAQSQAYAANHDPQMLEEREGCRRDPTTVFGKAATVADCQKLRQQASDFYPREPLDFNRLLQREAAAVTVLITGLVVLCGCTFAGADWSSGSIGNQLLAEPRRLRLWWAKGAAVVAASVAASVVLIGGFWLAMFLTARHRGIDVPDGVRRAVLEQAGRGVLLAVGGALGAYALTMLFRHTASTLALLFAYTVGGAILVNLLPISSATRWSLGNNVSGWLRDGFHYFADTGRCADGCALGHLSAGAFLLALLVVAVATSLLAFSRRDV